MTSEQQAVIEWCQKNCPELANPIERELRRGNLTYVTLIHVAYNAGKEHKTSE